MLMDMEMPFEKLSLYCDLRLNNSTSRNASQEKIEVIGKHLCTGMFITLLNCTT